MKLLLALTAVLAVLTGCRIEAAPDDAPSPTATTDGIEAPEDSLLIDKLAQYTTVRLTANLTELSDSTRLMIPHLIAAAEAMDEVFWVQAYGDRDSLLAGLGEAERRFAVINYGPWDRLDGDVPFLPGVEAKAPGANLYPADLTTVQLLETADLYPDRALTSPYTLVRREGDRLVGVPYHQAFAAPHARAARHLRRAADVAQDSTVATYLRLRADGLRTDDYRPSDLAWMDLSDRAPLDIVIGPVETYEDGLTGYKAAHHAYVLVKDLAWSQRLAQVAALLPELQRSLPVDSLYKAELPLADDALGVYDVLYAAGSANAGPKTVALHLPNDEQVRHERGSRRLQLRNVMRAKVDRILVPIADVLLVEDQRANVTFDAVFGNAMFHKVAHGLGVQRTVDGQQTVREALQDRASALEEGKADVLGLYMVESLVERGAWTEASLLDHQVTSVASVFRAIRFGASSARGRAALLRFNVFREQGAIVDESTEDGVFWRVVPERVSAASDSLSARILTLQGDGDYGAVDAFVRRYGRMTPELERSLDRVSDAGIPVDIVFEQGVEVLGLAPVRDLPPAVGEDAGRG